MSSRTGCVNALPKRVYLQRAGDKTEHGIRTRRPGFPGGTVRTETVEISPNSAGPCTSFHRAEMGSCRGWRGVKDIISLSLWQWWEDVPKRM